MSKSWMLAAVPVALVAAAIMAGCSRPAQTANSAAAVEPPYPAPIEALVKQGMTIDGHLPAPPGYAGYAGFYNGRLVPVYLLPDHRHTVIGTLYDANGKNLTSTAMEAAEMPTLDQADWARLHGSTWIADGTRHPKRIVYMFMDMDCPFCQQQWRAMQPLLKRYPQVQVRYVIVGVLTPQSPGRAAAVLQSRDPLATLRRNEQADGSSPIPSLNHPRAAVAAEIADNNSLMEGFGIEGTPGTVYKDARGLIRTKVGALSTTALEKIFSD